MAWRWDICLYFSPAKHAMKSVFKQFSLKKKNQKTETQAFASQAHFYPWILLHQGHRIFSTFCQTVDSIFFKFLCHYKIKCEHKTQGESPSLQSYTDVLSCEDSLSPLGGAGEGGHPARDTSEHTQPHPPKTVAGTQNSAKPTDFPSENQSTR